jgi:hypothetical protein
MEAIDMCDGLDTKFVFAFEARKSKHRIGMDVCVGVQQL